MNTQNAINEDRLIQAARDMQADQALAKADDDEIANACNIQAIISGPIEGGMSPPLNFLDY